MLTVREIDAVAPNLGQEMKMYLLRPTPGVSEPHICTLDELRTRYSLDDLADFHELLDLRAAASEKAERIDRQELNKNGGRGRR